MRPLPFVVRAAFAEFVLVAAMLLTGCAGTESKRSPQSPARPQNTLPTSPAKPTPPADEGLLLGIDVLERQGFAPLLGKRIGLLTHAAGVNRLGVSTIDVIRGNKRLNLVALYGVEHGVRGEIIAGKHYPDGVDAPSGLRVFSLYAGSTHKATPAQLAPIDVLVIDLQDIGTRSYTFISAMRMALEACFENNREVVVLDRPNPLGGLKVSGPILDAEWLGYLGAFRIPYVHGLTMGELARMSASEPGVLQIPDAVRARGKLTVVPMRGWRRAMSWPDNGLPWMATSPNIPGFDAVVGYPMTGLGAQLGGFRHGIGTPFPFRLLSHPAIPQLDLLAKLNSLALPGLRFSPRTITLPALANAKDQSPRTIAGVYVEVTDWNAWRPTELDFHMMQIAAAASPRKNPFAAASVDDASLFNKHVGSTAWWTALKRDGARVDVVRFFNEWEQQARAFQQQSQRFWLYR